MTTAWDHELCCIHCEDKLDPTDVVEGKCRIRPKVIQML